MKRKNLTRLCSVMLCMCMAIGLAAPAFAAEVADATIDPSKTANLTIYKYDFTNAAKDGVWGEDSYVSTGQYDANVNAILGTSIRTGDNDNVSDLGNGNTSNGYAIKGVEYTYLQVAEIYQYSAAEDNGAAVEVLYKFDKVKAANLLNAIGLPNGQGSHEKANALDDTAWFYQSDVISKALSDALIANPTTAKNALETYIKANGGTAMDETNENGMSKAENLPLGLYLLVETKVPEMVTETTNPFFVALPMTNVNGGGVGTQITDGGHAWLYDVTIYPKNETGIVTLEKTVRESAANGGANNGSATDINDGYEHSATASAGDTVEYQIISTLPTITSASTYISEYSFQDVLSAGLTYADQDLKVEWFKDTNCTELVTTWTEGDGNFSVAHEDNKMTIAMTEAGLAKINTTANNANGSIYSGYSNYTMRITYSAVLNSDAAMVYGDAGNSNKVVLTWKRTSSSYYDTLIDDCHVYTYGINLTKKFSDGKEDQALFDEVLFKIQNATDGYFVKAELNEAEGIWYVTGYTENEAEGTAIHPVTWNEKVGQIVVKGLENDEYILTEIETANSYTLLKDSIHVTIQAAEDASRPCEIYSEDALGVIQNDPRFNFDGGMDLALANIPQAEMAHNMLTASATVDGNEVEMLADEVDTTSTNALVPLTVTNTHGFNLPQTGETGAKWLPIVGGLIIGLSLLGFFYCMMPKRKNEEQ